MRVGARMPDTNEQAQQPATLDQTRRTCCVGSRSRPRRFHSFVRSFRVTRRAPPAEGRKEHERQPEPGVSMPRPVSCRRMCRASKEPQPQSTPHTRLLATQDNPPNNRTNRLQQITTNLTCGKSDHTPVSFFLHVMVAYMCWNKVTGKITSDHENRQFDVTTADLPDKPA